MTWVIPAVRVLLGRTVVWYLFIQVSFQGLLTGLSCVVLDLLVKVQRVARSTDGAGNGGSVCNTGRGTDGAQPRGKS